MRSLPANLLSAVTVGGSASWPPVDVLVVDASTDRTVRVWHEGGSEAATLLQVLNDDLAAMELDDFLQKWDLALHG
jgi:hypothetical protein